MAYLTSCLVRDAVDSLVSVSESRYGSVQFCRAASRAQVMKAAYLKSFQWRAGRRLVVEVQRVQPLGGRGSFLHLSCYAGLVG